ncbi:acetyltransferase (GNAT) family protein [Aquimarina sp. MAR_2010_214]|uniref:GNAT family N-acetyltransferase n=1 Tax=Aquimarina sp. MAR_2010_214 TaxID=1250026 RepID=UPI000C71564C|nr:GNAT family N-acetyltransferase [Aquimarina sp. MAR_2010_214]PKV50997.1 acetyltransferase (GNAT) family protein [Aquimarina sp. MAR_2010_214]
MEQNYKLLIKNLDESSDIIEYKTLLQKKWNNNVYYSTEHLLHFEKNSDKLKYFLFEKDNIPIILMPFVFREIKVKDQKHPYFDVISPYGYSGPLFNNPIPEEDIAQFWNHVDRWYKDNNVITEFIRFSLNENHTRYSGCLTKTLSNVRGCLLENFEDQWMSFLPKVRNNYRKAINFNLEFKVFHKHEITKDIIKIFNDIYVSTMNRNNADRIYFFSNDYFENLILSNLDNISIAIAYYENIPISIELIIGYKETIFAFLGGTNAEYFSYRPNDFLRVKIIEWAIKNQFKNYVLGGGMKDGDGLYKNKKSLFPKDEDVIFYTGRKIINEKIYDELCLIANADYNSNHKENVKDYFFPFYRSSI